MNKTKREILEKIKDSEIQMKPRWKFVAKAWELRSLWILMILAVALSISGIVYFIKIYNPVELAEFGDLGTELFFTDFPYLWLLGVVVFFAGGAVLMSKIGDNYKKTTRLVLVLTTITVVAVTLIVLAMKSLLKIGI